MGCWCDSFRLRIQYSRGSWKPTCAGWQQHLRNKDHRGRGRAQGRTAADRGQARRCEKLSHRLIHFNNQGFICHKAVKYWGGRTRRDAWLCVHACVCRWTPPAWRKWLTRRRWRPSSPRRTWFTSAWPNTRPSSSTTTSPRLTSQTVSAPSPSPSPSPAPALCCAPIVQPLGSRYSWVPDAACGNVALWWLSHAAAEASKGQMASKCVKGQEESCGWRFLHIKKPAVILYYIMQSSGAKPTDKRSSRVALHCGRVNHMLYLLSFCMIILVIYISVFQPFLSQKFYKMTLVWN